LSKKGGCFSSKKQADRWSCRYYSGKREKRRRGGGNSTREKGKGKKCYAPLGHGGPVWLKPAHGKGGGGKSSSFPSRGKKEGGKGGGLPPVGFR